MIYPYWFHLQSWNDYVEEKVVPPRKPSSPIKPEPKGLWWLLGRVSNKSLKTYEDAVRKYSFFLKSYQSKLEEYKKQVKRTEAKNTRLKLELLQDKFNRFCSGNDDLELINFINKRGVSEAVFKEELMKEFGDDLYTNKCFDGLLGYPDSLLFKKIRNNQYIIDIEIDEPYIAENGYMNHFIVHASWGSTFHLNSQRDEMFNKNGILVLRFAEEQVVKYPKECIEFIKILFSSIENLTFPEKEINFNDLPKINCWTEQEALEMSNQDYRNTYLKNISIPTAKTRGMYYKVEDFFGKWKDQDCKLLIEPWSESINRKFKYDFGDGYIRVVLKDKSSFSGSLNIYHDILHISILEINNRRLDKFEKKNKYIRHKILSWSEEQFVFMDEKSKEESIFVRFE